MEGLGNREVYICVKNERERKRERMRERERAKRKKGSCEGEK